MKSTFLGLLALGLAATPTAANAQITDLEYQSNVDGFSTYLQNGVINSADISGEITGSLTVEGNISSSTPMQLLSFDFNFVGNNGYTDGFGGPGFAWVSGPALGYANGTWIGPGGGPYRPFGFSTIALVSSNGAITGATVDLSTVNPGVSVPQSELIIGSLANPLDQGAAYHYEYANPLYGGCEGFITAGANATINPCSVDVGSSGSSTRTVVTTLAPEFDPSSTFGGVTLLLGVSVVVGGRRSINAP